MKLFISQPMAGKTDKEILDERERVLCNVKELFPDKEIEVKVEDYKCIFGKARIWRKPIIRGMVSFIDSLVTGTKCLMYSAEIAGDEEDEEEVLEDEDETEDTEDDFFEKDDEEDE